MYSAENPSSFMFSIDEKNVFAETLGRVLLLTDYLLHLEVGTRESLPRYYGGGYELAAFIGGQFTKIDDVAWAFWYAETGTPQGIRLHLPHAYMKAAYKEDVMLIRSFLPKKTPGGRSATL